MGRFLFWFGGVVFFIFLFLLFRTTGMAYGSPQVRGPIGAAAVGLYHSRKNARSKAWSVIYVTAHGNTGFLTHQVKPGIEPTSSWLLVRFVYTEP